ncbi:hypothetical protein [Aestuariimicrobium ganziense]|uniref:hypothetical protein n=1 Tax=Aestuariimicrobium ganziense TaxID=2773677 RepID=UPI001F267271|nr:hypothetical protein [Aestuariimicrobium ganziense]
MGLLDNLLGKFGADDSADDQPTAAPDPVHTDDDLDTGPLGAGQVITADDAHQAAPDVLTGRPDPLTLPEDVPAGPSDLPADFPTTDVSATDVTGDDATATPSDEYH